MDNEVRLPDLVITERLINSNYHPQLNEETDQNVLRAIKESLLTYENDQKYEKKVLKLKEESDRKHNESIIARNEYLKEKSKLDQLKRDSKNLMLRDILAILSRIKNDKPGYDRIYKSLVNFINSDEEYYDIKENDFPLIEQFVVDLGRRKNISQEKIDYFMDHGFVDQVFDEYVYDEDEAENV